MDKLNLVKYFKANKVLETDIGCFTYVKKIGDGGNSTVLLFSRGNIDFAIKLLIPENSSKLNRFKDEFFCCMQIAGHENVVRPYHFDMVNISGYEVYVIIMKCYSGSLNKVGIIKDEDCDKAWRVFCDLLDGIKYLHKNNIIHRDLKPHNIFYDNENNKYVIGDFGIAQFSEGGFSKLSKTKSDERLGNYLFSAPEQADSKNNITCSADIYALGQIVNWLFTGKTIKGLSRKSFSKSNSPSKVKILDSIVDKCIQNDPENRFQSIDEIIELINNPKRDIWDRFHDFDEAICSSFPSIHDIYETAKDGEISRFIEAFNKKCRKNEFWYVTLEGGDCPYSKITRDENNKWIFRDYEIDIEKLIIYRDSNFPYKSFFIILVSPSVPFETFDKDNLKISRSLYPGQKEDVAYLWKNKYIEYSEAKNGYYDAGYEIIKTTEEEFKFRTRYLVEYAFIIVPQGSAASKMSDSSPVEKMLESVVLNKSLSKSELNKFIKVIKPYHGIEITMRN